MRRSHGLFIVAGCVLATLSANCSNNGVAGPDDQGTLPGPDTTALPLTQLGTHTYLGFGGGLYDAGSDAAPADHATIGATRARNIRPLNAQGTPAAGGKVVLLSIGMSNTSQEFCGVDVTVNCVAGSFMAQAMADGAVTRSALVLVNGAQGGRDAIEWTSASSAPYNVVREERLATMGVTEKQVQVAWLLEATKRPTVSLPAANADAFALETNLGLIVRALSVRYPNLQQVYISNRIYGGYATTAENPEPYAYETGFAVKWLVQAQISQMRNGGHVVDARAGDLNYNSVAPWIAWGPDMWAAGTTPRLDGLTWQPSDFKSDGTHPSVESGVPKAGGLLLRFFTSSPTTSCWFLANRSCL